jgi:hypothetical protein
MDGVRVPGGGLLRAIRTDLDLAISLFNKEEGDMTEKTLLTLYAKNEVSDLSPAEEAALRKMVEVWIR